MQEKKKCYECINVCVDQENAFIVGSCDNNRQCDDGLHKSVNKSVLQHYESPSLYVQEVLLELGFMVGSHEDFEIIDYSHENILESDQRWNDGDIVFQ